MQQSFGNMYDHSRPYILQPAQVHPAVNVTWQKPLTATRQDVVTSANMNDVHTLLNNAPGIVAGLFNFGT
jgi:hypothetical protein